jgi:hypothetical protein
MVCTSCGIIGADARPNWQEPPPRETPNRDAVAMTKPSSGEERRALGMLAGSPDGCTKSVLLAHGLKDETLTGLVDKGLAKSTPGTVRIGPSQRPINVTWLTITAEGRKALAGT